MSPDSGYVQMEGTDESFLRLVELSENANDDDTYNEICQMLDIDEYINYMAVELYLGGNDWPQNNVKGFRDKNGGKFHFVLFDLDGTLSSSNPFSTFFNKERYTFDRLYGYDYSQEKSIDNTRKTRDIKFVTLFKNMLKNSTFRKKFIDSFCIMGGSVFQPKHVQSIVGAVADKLASGGVNPYGTSNNIINTLGSTDYNNNMSTQLKNCSHMNLSNTARQSVSIASNNTDGKIELNGILLPYSEFDGYLYAPVTLKAVAPAGYAFAGWTSSSSSATSTIFNEGSNWRYYDKGSLDGKNWNATSYSATGWSSGNAPIGYGKNQATTTEGNLPCYYFRNTFSLTSTPSANDVYTLRFTIDDGAVVYVNGKEAGRYNMPAGDTYYSTLATSYAPNNPDTGEMTIDASLLKKGTNTIAVEVHNNSTASSDILWDASLTVTKKTTGSECVSSEAEYTLPANGAQKVIAVFEKIEDEDMLAQGITPVRVNEVSAANSMYVNDYFKKNDWIELYNTTDDDIDIAGMYVSDNLKKPEKYQVPSDNVTLNTVIPAHGYKVVWCDKLESIGTDIHTSFKLAADGGDVLIKTDAYADTLTYTAHIGTESFGRYPDGANDTYVMNAPSIGKANRLSSCDTRYVKPVDPDPVVPDGIASFKKESGVSMAYVDGVINIKSEDADIKSVSVFSAAGVKASAAVRTKQGERYATVMAHNLPKGVYVVRVIIDGNDEYSMKIGIK